MKKLFFVSLMALCLGGLVASCSKDDAEEMSGDAAVAELKSLLGIQEDGTSAFLQDEKTLDYFLGVDNAETAGRVANNLSMGATALSSLTYTLPDSKGTISVAANAAEGHYYDITYNVAGISVKKLNVVNNAWLENENVTFIRPQDSSNKPSTWICNPCKYTFSSKSKVNCPRCRSSNVQKK
ncbi:MAG: hypothetical protein MJY79_07195 [Bacteroidaceae bacterium]|nr:hypothetical protein [Bacteroidaceae bacterium]